MKNNFENQFNYTGGINRYETNDGVSKTIQGEAYTIAELMKRVTSGMPMPGNSEPNYMDQEDLDKINHMHSRNIDLIDLDEFKLYNKQLEQSIKDAQKRRQEARLKEEKDRLENKEEGTPDEDKKPDTTDK